MENKPQVYAWKSHQLLYARQNLAATEQDMLLLFSASLKDDQTHIDKIKESGSVPPSLKLSYSYSVKKLAQLAGKKDFKSYSEKIKKYAKTLTSRSVFIDNGNDDFEIYHFCSAAVYKNHELTLSIDPLSAQKILLEIKGYSLIDIAIFLSLKGSYEKRLFELISRHKEKPEYRKPINLDILEGMMGKEIASYTDKIVGFRRAVLEKPFQNIFKASNGEWEPTDKLKRGFEFIYDEKDKRKVKSVQFCVKWNNPKDFKKISKKEAQERQKLETQSNAVIAELIAMEDAILSIENMDTFNKIMITGYQGEAQKCGYKIPQNVADKIKSLL